MKIFNKENGKEKVYVQMQDIMTVVHEDINCGIPASIFEKVFGDILIVDDSNRWDFMMFDEPEEIEFFKKLEWALDYKEARKLSCDDINKAGYDVAVEHDEIGSRLKDLSKEELKNHEDEIRRYKLLESLYHMYGECFMINRGHKTMPFPVVADSDGYDCGSNDEYEAVSTLDPSKIIIRRKDGQPLNKGKISKKYIKEVIANGSVQMSEARATYCTIGNAKYTISEDGMSIILSYQVEPILSKEEIEFKKNNTFVKRMKRKLMGQPEIVE